MNRLEQFIHKCPSFETLPITSKVDLFTYYLLYELKQDFFIVREINDCFEKLNLQKYSNVAVYLSRSSNPKNKSSKYVKKKEGYVIERSFKQQLEKLIGKPIRKEIEGELFPMELIKDTRGYIENIGYQANACYHYGFYDAALVMVRKLLETLIIELFESRKLSDKIMDSSGHFLFLSDLIPIFSQNTDWALSRNTKTSLPTIKKFGDLSAHNRRFNAKKSDLDGLKNDLRIVIEELIHLINY